MRGVVVVGHYLLFLVDDSLWLSNATIRRVVHANGERKKAKYERQKCKTYRVLTWIHSLSFWPCWRAAVVILIGVNKLVLTFPKGYCMWPSLNPTSAVCRAINGNGIRYEIYMCCAERYVLVMMNPLYLFLLDEKFLALWLTLNGFSKLKPNPLVLVMM